MLGAMALAQTPPEEPAVGEPGQTEAEESPEAPTSQPVAEEEEPKSVLEALLTGERATGDWGGARPWLEECGVTFDMTLTTFFQSVAHGGLNTRRAHTILGVNALELTLDLGKMKLIPGGTMYVYATNSWGESPTTRGWTGDLFDVNGIELGNHPINVHELWYEQALLDNKLRVRFGRIMLPNSFDTNAFAFDTTLDFTNWGLNHAANIPFPAKAGVRSGHKRSSLRATGSTLAPAWPTPRVNLARPDSIPHSTRTATSLASMNSVSRRNGRPGGASCPATIVSACGTTRSRNRYSLTISADDGKRSR
jgi:hypothetical protein